MSDVGTLRDRLLAELSALSDRLRTERAALRDRPLSDLAPPEAMYALADDALATVARVEHYDQQYKAGVRTVAQLAWPKNQPLPTAEALAAVGEGAAAVVQPHRVAGAVVGNHRVHVRVTIEITKRDEVAGRRARARAPMRGIR